jgi:small subunit ribosomal protein S6
MELSPPSGDHEGTAMIDSISPATQAATGPSATGPSDPGLATARPPRPAPPALDMAVPRDVRYDRQVARVDPIRFPRRNDADYPPVADRLQPFKSEGGGLVTHQYELMVILDPEIDERTVAPSLDKFLNVIRNDGGTIDNIDIWGRRRLAYEINKKTEGIYAVVNFTANSAATDELDRQLKLSEAVMRTKVLRAEEGFALVAAEAKRAEAKAARASKAPAKAAAKDA